MSFISTISAAPRDADYAVYKDVGGYVFLSRDPETGRWDVMANTDAAGFAMLGKGLSASAKSLWDYDSGLFLAGDVEQLDRAADRTSKWS